MELDSAIQYDSSSVTRRFVFDEIDRYLQALGKIPPASVDSDFEISSTAAESSVHETDDRRQEVAAQLPDIFEAPPPPPPRTVGLFTILGMYEKYSSESSRSEAKDVDLVLVKLSESVMVILTEFEQSLVTDSPSFLSDLPIHRLPKYVMSYVNKLCDHKQTLMALSLRKPSTIIDGTGTGLVSFVEFEFFEAKSVLSLHVIWIITSLLSNLDRKAKRVSASANRFFAMSNAHYIVQRIVERPVLRDLVGDRFFKKLVDKFELAKAEYLSSTLSSTLPVTVTENGLNDYRIDDEDYINFVTTGNVLVEVESTGQVALDMPRLVDKFRDLLRVDANSALNNSFSSISSATMSDDEEEGGQRGYEIHEEDYIMYNAISINVLVNLRNISLTMSDAGNLQDCAQLYITERRRVMNVGFQRLNVQKLTSPMMRKLGWGTLEAMIKDWITSAKVCLNVLFPNEKRFCEQIFKDLGDGEVVESCFFETVKDPAIQLFNNAEALSNIRPSPERIFRILDMYETLSDLSPQISSLFQSGLGRTFITKAKDQILPSLAESVKVMLSDFEKCLLTEESPASSTQTLAIHRLTEYVMSYASQLCDRRRTLMALSLLKPPMDGAAASLESVEFPGQSLLSLHVVWIVMSLVSNLDGKAKGASAANLLFAMNNVHHIIQKIEGREELSDLVGDDYLKKLAGKFERAKDEYLGLTLKNVLGCLKDEGLKRNGRVMFSSKAARLTQRLKAFNNEFEKVHQNLARLAVPDYQLLADLRKSIAEKVVPGYASFLGQCNNLPGLENHIKYSVEDLETKILAPRSYNLER